MGDVANSAIGITGFLQRLYKPIYVWAIGVFATKADLDESGKVPATQLPHTYATDSDIEALFDSEATQPDGNKLVKVGQLSKFLEILQGIIEDNELVTASALTEQDERIQALEDK